MEKLSNFLTMEYATGNNYPRNKEDIFKAYRLAPWESLRVVIIGDEPHFSSGYHALAYSDEYIHAYHNGSITSIAACIEREYYDGLNLDFDYSLESWAKQGVLMLNRSITVKANNIHSHRKPWNKFFLATIQAIVDYKPGTIFMLWGKEQYEDIIPMLHNQHVFTWEHPHAALMERREWNCPNFKQVDKLLEHLNGRENIIKW